MNKMGGSDRIENLVGRTVESRASKNAVYAKVYIWFVDYTTSNLVLWNMEKAACALCKGYANLKHILSCCKVALTQGRYRWCHDQVLRVIAERIEELRRGKAEGKPRKNIVFVKEGTSLKKSHSKGQKNLHDVNSE